MAEDMINIEVAYALRYRQRIISLKVPAGTTAEQAIRQSGILDEFTGIDLAGSRIGVFSKLCKGDQVLREGDRVEIYRPLIADPKEVRRKRAAEGKEMKKGSGTQKVRE